MRIHGACHCGNIAFDLDWPEGVPVAQRACGCTFCQKHGATWTANPQAALHVHIVDGSRVSRHRFGTQTADFQVCASCGVVPVCTSEIDGRLYAVVNTRTFDNGGALSDPVSVDFDGEAEDARLARRTKNWIGNVAFVGM
ncbi:hypothetical protein ABIE56_001361 [Luteibacter sp. 621]|uniref:GFA family protein n=1 Tax=Luteibacter sp. 621 TaxID=3373916 RepID=UPI003D22039C